MVRTYYRRTPRSNNRDKYSVENTVVLTPSSNSWTVVPAVSGVTQSSKQFSIPIVPAADVQGMRKVKHLTLSFSSASDVRLCYVLVYVPEGYDPNPIRVPNLGYATSLYEPNQYVMSSGTLDFSGGPLRIRTPLSRNLNSGDSIHLILAQWDEGNVAVSTNVKYAITLQ